MDVSKLSSGLKRGERAALARAITIAEDNPAAFSRLIRGLYNPKRIPAVIGITGPPGCGKSSLISAMAPILAKRGMKLGIIAIDASSPFTGGSFLGNRIRMEQTVASGNIFMRSIASRGSKGGLATPVMNAIIALSCAGYDMVLVESVGAGQSDIDILNISSTVLLVLAPGLGDEIQAMKAGSMEIADIFVVNKSDLPGSDEAKRVIVSYLHTLDNKGTKEAISTSCASGKGIDDLVSMVLDHESTIDRSTFAEKAFRMEVDRIARDLASKHIGEYVDSRRQVVQRMLGKGTDPYSAALSLLKSYHAQGGDSED